MLRSWFGDLLRVILCAFLFALVFTSTAADAQAFGCGGGLFAKIKERRQARQSGSEMSAGYGAGACADGGAAEFGYGYNPQPAFGYAVQQQYATYPSGPHWNAPQPLAFSTQYVPASAPSVNIPATDIPLPAAQAGALAVFDGKVWKLVHAGGVTTRAGCPCGNVCPCTAAANCGSPDCPAVKGFRAAVHVNAPAAPVYYSAPQPAYYAPQPQAGFGYGFGSGPGVTCVGGKCYVNRR